MKREIYAIHPGYHISEELTERGVSQADLARPSGVRQSRVRDYSWPPQCQCRLRASTRALDGHKR
jgi:hypothetical protein